MVKVEDKDHLVVTKSDFILEHKGRPFNEVYRTDA